MVHFPQTPQEWLGEHNQVGLNIYEKKYRYDNETFPEFIDRVSGGDKALGEQIASLKFLPGGRIMAGRGVSDDIKVSYSNCYVVSPPEDNLESIFDTAKRLARIYSYGGGSGVDISGLSPAGAAIRNAAKTTSGAVSFIDLYARVTKLIGQKGRRGAMMISLDCGHPDLPEFIKLKTDPEKATSANLSIRVNNDFMEAVKQGKDWTMQFTRKETGETVERTIPAREIMRMFAEANWRAGEPGVLFWDHIAKDNLLEYVPDFHYAGTNPCFAGNMRLLTTEGYKTFEELCDTEPFIYNINGDVVKSKVWKTGKKETVSIKTAFGTVISTPDHRFMTNDGTVCMAKDLKGKRLMPFVRPTKTNNSKFVKFGFIQGDGNLSRLKSKYHTGLEVNIGKNDVDVYDLFEADVYTKASDRTIYVQNINEELRSFGFSDEILPYRTFPKTYENWSKDEKAAFLQGCYSANGSVIKEGRIAYKTTCRKFADQLKHTLIFDFGITNVYITTNKSTKVKFKNGEYQCRESYDVNIGQYTDLITFATAINFYQQHKKEQLSKMLRKRAPYVIDVKPHKKIDVYDFEEPETHWGIVEGYVVHNCGEEPLPENGSCLLGSINLSAFVKDPFTDLSYLDMSELRETVRIVVKGMNDILDEGVEKHPLKAQQAAARDWRQIGIGVMGFGDMLLKLNIRYGSKEAEKIIDEIGYELAKTALEASIALAKTDGPFPMMKDNKKMKLQVMKSEFFKNHADSQMKDDLLKYGIRNSQLLTIAPTGSISTMIGVSGGMEPLFAFQYTMKTESLDGKESYYNVDMPVVKAYREAYGLSESDPLPYTFVSAHDIPYKKRINMQAAWQRHIDASISSTCNLPNSCTVEDVKNLYLYAYEKNLKGITVFRDGCDRAPVLTAGNHAEKKEPEDKKSETMPKGSDDVYEHLIGRRRKLITGCGSLHLIAMFHEDTGELYEIFLNKGSTGGCNSFMNALSRFVSKGAQKGMTIDEICDQLSSSVTCVSYRDRTRERKDTSHGTSCPSAVGYALRDMYDKLQAQIRERGGVTKAEEPAHTEKIQAGSESVCPNCGMPLVFEGGCNVCKNCGWSKCF